MKNLMFAFFLLLTYSFSHQSIAQNTFEYAVLEYCPESMHVSTPTINVSINGVEFYRIKLSPSANRWVNLKAHEKGLNPLLSQISEMSQDGWNVMSFQTRATEEMTSYFAYLSRKKP